MAASAAAFAGSSSAEPYEFTVKADKDYQHDLPPKSSSLGESGPYTKPRNRGNLSQRQIRKDRRRAHAAGCKKAFL